MASVSAISYHQPKDASKKRGSDEVPQEESGFGMEKLRNIDLSSLLHVFGGQQLLEVFSVVINNKGKKQRRVSGTISTLDFCHDSEYIFSREGGNPVTIKPNDTTPLLLNGPVGCISANTDFEIVVKLVDDVSNKLLTGFISFCQFSRHLMPEYNKPVIFRRDMDKKVKGRPAFSIWNKEEEDGSSSSSSSMFVEVKLALISQAVSATIEVKVIDHGGGAANVNCNANAKVYGRLTTICEHFGEGWEIVLFDKEGPSESEDGNVICMNAIPLSRSVLAVPAKSGLIFRANLHDGEGKEIAGGSTTFPVVPCGIMQQNICGMYSEICVKVTWQAWPDLPTPLISDSDMQC